MDSAPRAPAVVDRRVPRTARTWPGMLALVIGLSAICVPVGLAETHARTVVLMGDSLMAEGAPAVGAFLHFQGYSVQSGGAVPGAGLLDTQVSWLAKGRQLIAAYDPTTVVVEYVGNYASFGGIPGVSVYSRAFYNAWALKAQQLENILASRGAQVYWVIGPPVSPPVPQAGIVVLDRIYQHLHAPNTESGRPPLIDVTPALTGGTGKYTEYLPGPGGTPVQVRQPDGVHFTSYGAALFGRAIAAGVT
jgi:hypothetical protein